MKVLIIGAKGMPSAEDREKTESWLNRFFKGAFAREVKIINAEAVSVVKVGGGMEDLKSGYSEIQRGAIEGIGAAFGIPAGIFMSDKAYAVEMDALIRMWYSSSQFIAIYQCIEDTFNSQLFRPLGYEMRFLPNTLDAFQEDETKRAAAFRDYTDAGILPSVAAQMLGLELPENVTPESLDEKFKADMQNARITAERGPQLQIGNTDKPDNRPNREMPKPLRKSIALDPDGMKELVAWRERAQKWFTKGKSAAEWECKYIPGDIAEQVRGKLKTAKSELDIVRAFEIETENDVDGMWAVAEALNRLADK